MKIQIRKSVFETNSSSTHAINIFRGSDYIIPKEITIKPGEFGWEWESYHTPEDKLSYLYTWCLSKCSSWEENEITKKWEEHYDYKKLKDYQYRIKTKLEEAGVEEINFEKLAGYYDNGYIDHSNELMDEDLETILEDYFLDFVFNDSSYIKTGNDNSDDSRVYESSRADFSIYKGN